MSIIQEIKRRLDIVEVVSEFVPLSRVGKYYRALCPFHSERHPSFYVMPDSQRWHCFGACSTGGDIFSFVMKKENLPFAEAVKFLAQKAGVKLEAYLSEREEDKRLYQLNEAAADFYHRQLGHSPEASLARSYLKKRGISLSSLLAFKLGYSPRQGKALKNHLLSLGYCEEEMVKGGLIREDGVELLRGRLLFPIKDISGRIVGFGGRCLDDSLPKYLNSPATPIFEKGSLLYGLYEAKDQVRKENQVVLVEGYIDVVIAHQYGFKNVVGTMGVALTEKQLRKLKNYTKNIILALDADKAGLEATLRGMETAVKILGETIPVPHWQGIVRYESVIQGEIKVLPLPQDKDPDDIIKMGGWEGLISQAVPVLEFLIQTLGSQYDLSKLEEKATFIGKLKPLFGQIKDPLKWAYYVGKLAAKLNIEERYLADALRVPPDRVSEAPYIPTTRPLEDGCLAFLLTHPELRDEVNIPPEYFLETVNREIFLAWKNSPEPALIREHLSPPLQEHLDQILSQPLPEVDEKEKVLERCLRRLRENFLRSLLKLEGEILGAEEISALKGLRELLKGG